LAHHIALIAPDLRGFGQSEGPRGHILRFEEYLDDLEILVARLQKQYPGTPLFLFGHSLGGLICIRYDQTNPGMIDGALLSSPALGLRILIPYPLKKLTEFIAWITPGLAFAPLKWVNTLRNVSWLKPIMQNTTPDMLFDPLCPNVYTSRWLSELLLNGAKAISEAAKFTAPTLCLYDQHDPLIDARLIRQFFDAISSQDKTSVLFSEGRHKHLHEFNCERAVNAILQWMNTRLGFLEPLRSSEPVE
jgi:lysophospholipase